MKAGILRRREGVVYERAGFHKFRIVRHENLRDFVVYPERVDNGVDLHAVMNHIFQLGQRRAVIFQEEFFVQRNSGFAECAAEAVVGSVPRFFVVQEHDVPAILFQKLLSAEISPCVIVRRDRARCEPMSFCGRDHFQTLLAQVADK